MRKRHEAEEVFPKFPRSCKLSRSESGRAICENVLGTMESMAESFDRTPAKPSLAKRRRFQTFKKVHHEKRSLATVDEKDDTCVNSEVRSSVVK